jgi:hypothetical protein
MTKELKETLANITGTFTGEYGGVKYVMFVQSLTQIEQKAVQGDAAAKEIILLCTRFSKLINVLVPEAFKGPE